jgi:hypothetical protein
MTMLATASTKTQVRPTAREVACAKSANQRLTGLSHARAFGIALAGTTDNFAKDLRTEALQGVPWELMFHAAKGSEWQVGPRLR